MNLASKYIQDVNGTKYAPITTPNAIRWPDGSNLNDKLSAFDSLVIEAPVDSTDPTDPITTLTCSAGIYYRVDVPVETLSITLPSMTDNTTVRGLIIFLTGGTTPNVTFISADNGVDILYSKGFEIASGKIYEINAIWNGSAWCIASVEMEVQS